jgi:hypothetical protein
LFSNNNCDSFVGQVPLLLGIIYETGKGVPYPAGNEELMHFFDLNLTLFQFDFVCFYHGVFFVVRYLHKNNAVRIIIENKKLIGSVSPFYGLLLRLFPHYFYYTNPGDLY